MPGHLRTTQGIRSTVKLKSEAGSRLNLRNTPLDVRHTYVSFSLTVVGIDSNFFVTYKIARQTPPSSKRGAREIRTIHVPATNYAILNSTGHAFGSRRYSWSRALAQFLHTLALGGSCSPRASDLPLTASAHAHPQTVLQVVAGRLALPVVL